MSRNTAATAASRCERVSGSSELLAQVVQRIRWRPATGGLNRLAESDGIAFGRR
jgi:hypothetical protein